MKLIDLDPHFLRIIDEKTWRYEGVSIEEAQGVQFDCPVCYVKNGNTGVGTHSVICWFVNCGVPAELDPKPGRWLKKGSSFRDLSLGPSIKLPGPGGCEAHFHVTNGEITP
jgi:hypothetical protein